MAASVGRARATLGPWTDRPARACSRCCPLRPPPSPTSSRGCPPGGGTPRRRARAGTCGRS
ncbi:hypothetical protein [Ornithinimicrobium kibberense]|uniref:hypothetical protein n=1 Tax=Ornithinimicrobium kibberense TaxID=282060 RepID=UPI0036241EFD